MPPESTLGDADASARMRALLRALVNERVYTIGRRRTAAEIGLSVTVIQRVEAERPIAASSVRRLLSWYRRRLDEAGEGRADATDDAAWSMLLPAVFRPVLRSTGGRRSRPRSCKRISRRGSRSRRGYGGTRRGRGRRGRKRRGCFGTGRSGSPARDLPGRAPFTVP